MSYRNVLIIAYYFPPMGLSGVQRTLKFAKYLPKFGWKPFVLTTSPPAFYAFDETLDAELAESEIQVFRTTTKASQGKKTELKTRKFPSYFKQKIGRALLQTIYQPDSAIKWKKQAVELGRKIIQKHEIDVIFATAPPFTDFLVARELNKQLGIPYIIDYRDVWIDNPFHFFATPFHKSHSVRLERDILNHAKKAIVITRHTKELLLKRYHFISHNDISIIPHGYDPADFAGTENIKPNPEKFTITHSGLFQDNRTPKYFLKAISNFISTRPEAAKKIELRFLGLMRPGHLKLIKKYNLQGNTIISGYINHPETIKNLLESDVLWLMLNDTVRSPGKLFEYFGAGKPLLICAPDGMIKKIAIDSKAALATNPKDTAAIEQAIQTFYNLWKNNNLPAPNQSYTSQFNRVALTAELAKELALAAEI